MASKCEKNLRKNCISGYSRSGDKSSGAQGGTLPVCPYQNERTKPSQECVRNPPVSYLFCAIFGCEIEQRARV